jgi:hypothetical protein
VKQVVVDVSHVMTMQMNMKPAQGFQSIQTLQDY